MSFTKLSRQTKSSKTRIYYNPISIASSQTLNQNKKFFPPKFHPPKLKILIIFQQLYNIYIQHRVPWINKLTHKDKNVVDSSHPSLIQINQLSSNPQSFNSFSFNIETFQFTSWTYTHSNPFIQTLRDNTTRYLNI